MNFISAKQEHSKRGNIRPSTSFGKKLIGILYSPVKWTDNRAKVDNIHFFTHLCLRCWGIKALMKRGESQDYSYLISILPKNQAAPIEMVISDFFRILKTFIAFVSLCHKSPKAKGKP